MGNCLVTRSSHINKVSSNAKPETPKIQSPSVRDRSDERKLPSNPGEVEALRRGSSAAAGRNPLVAFSFAELKKLASDFRQEALIGGGGFGRVYKGAVPSPDGRGEPLPVAVKVHDGDNSFQGHREWLAEVIFLGQLSHPNLVKLVGYCCEGDAHRVLVYEYMPLGSVESHLFPTRTSTASSSPPPLSWAARMRIALGAARGLAFLHDGAGEGLAPAVIYRDLKTSNILLDADFNAKLSDFGLAKAGPVGDSSHVSTRVMGTYGYAAPEYVMTGHLTPMSDVYSYGVVLLELLTGRRSLDRSRPPREQALADWALPALPHKKRAMAIVDPRLLDAVDGAAELLPARSVHKAAMLAYHCLNRNPKARPLMRDVVASLEPLQQPPEDPAAAA